MDVRDAVEADAPMLAEIIDAPTDVLRNVIHDRTVRVAVEEAHAGPNADVGGEEPTDVEDIVGFVSFDAREDTVYVTQLGGSSEACERLLGEPIRFATIERMSVELLVEAVNEQLQEVAEAVGFTALGSGPRFGDEATVAYALDPHEFVSDE